MNKLKVIQKQYPILKLLLTNIIGKKLIFLSNKKDWNKFDKK